ncbi:MAG: LON peptidase substrate-binding domain-containing protein [Verrucomicrobia bacterium]|nr:LON peptidase substrate-binding domain-containing protein [Verrucomicrobiota bacterium]
MTLPHATLFPQALLPLYIFEPRYRQMLADALATHRLFIVARQRPACRRETPEPVAGLGLIRASVSHKDGTSHLVLQGISRVRLRGTVRYKPYRVQRIEPIRTPDCDSVAADALMAKVLELVEDLVHLGLPLLPLGLPAPGGPGEVQDPAALTADVLRYLHSIRDTETLADLVGGTLLHDPDARQALLEVAELEARLRLLIQFLLAEIRLRRESGGHE